MLILEEMGEGDCNVAAAWRRHCDEAPREGTGLATHGCGHRCGTEGARRLPHQWGGTAAKASAYHSLSELSAP